MKYLEKFIVYQTKGNPKKAIGVIKNTLYDIQDIFQELHDDLDQINFTIIHDIDSGYNIKISYENWKFFKIEPFVEYLQRLLFYIKMNKFIVREFQFSINPAVAKRKGFGNGQGYTYKGHELITLDYIHPQIDTILTSEIILIFK